MARRAGRIASRLPARGAPRRRHHGNAARRPTRFRRRHHRRPSRRASCRHRRSTAGPRPLARGGGGLEGTGATAATSPNACRRNGRRLACNATGGTLTPRLALDAGDRLTVKNFEYRNARIGVRKARPPVPRCTLVTGGRSTAPYQGAGFNGLRLQPGPELIAVGVEGTTNRVAIIRNLAGICGGRSPACRISLFAASVALEPRRVAAAGRPLA